MIQFAYNHDIMDTKILYHLSHLIKYSFFTLALSTDIQIGLRYLLFSHDMLR